MQDCGFARQAPSQTIIVTLVSNSTQQLDLSTRCLVNLLSLCSIDVDALRSLAVALTFGQKHEIRSCCTLQLFVNYKDIRLSGFCTHQAVGRRYKRGNQVGQLLCRGHESERVLKTSETPVLYCALFTSGRQLEVWNPKNVSCS